MSKKLPENFFKLLNLHPDLKADVWFNFQVGRIVGQVNSVEMVINGLISSYYGATSENDHQKLKDDIVLPMALDAKIKLVKKIALDLGVKFTRQNRSDLYRWKEIRNVVAHGVPLHTGAEGNNAATFVLVYDSKFYDVDELTEDFFERQVKLTEYLKTLQDLVHS